MLTATFTANPFPYSKACDTSRPRIGLGAAIRAGLGGIALVDFLKPRAMLNSLVRKLTSEGRPTRIHYRLGQLGSGKPASRHIAYCNQIKLAHDAGAEFVQEISSSVRCPGLYRFDAPLLVGSLCLSQGAFSVPVQSGRSNLFTIGQNRKVLESKVDANAALDGSCSHWGDFNANVEEPVSPAVLREVRTVLDAGALRQRSAFENLELTPVEVKARRGWLELAALQRNPAQVPFSSVAKIRALLLRSGFGVLFAHRIDRAGVNSQLFARTRGELVEVKATEPLASKAKRIFLPVVAIVEDKVHCPGLLVEQAVERFDPVSVHEQHTVYNNSTREIVQALRRYAPALYLPGLNAGVSREF